MVGQGKDNTQEQIRHYIGYATCKVLGINVSKERFKELTGYDRGYEFKAVDVITNPLTQTSAKCANIEVIFRTVPERNNSIDHVFVKTFTIIKRNMTSKNKTTCVIDRFGRFAWVTMDELNNLKVNLREKKDNSGKYVVQIDEKSMRMAYSGEQSLMSFVKSYVGLDTVSKFDKGLDGKVHYIGLKDNADNYQCRFDDIEKFFDGDFTELQNAVKNHENNYVVLTIGVRHKENSSYNYVYSYVVKPFEWTRDLEQEIMNRRKNNQLQDVDFDFKPLHVYSENNMNTINAVKNIAPSTFSSQETPIQSIQPTYEDDDLPF